MFLMQLRICDQVTLKSLAFVKEDLVGKMVDVPLIAIILCFPQDQEKLKTLVNVKLVLFGIPYQNTVYVLQALNWCDKIKKYLVYV